tara:strand:- start:2426 stop:2785 length:360 start_codon:yes stop_codon:yes gene_type:complete
MKFIFKIIVLALIIFAIKLIYLTNAEAGGPWNDQYCDMETTQIRVVDSSGNVIEEKTEEKVTCNDGVKDFLHGMGIAENCQIFTWIMYIGGKEVEHRSIACKKLDGTGYEIVKGYHSLH